MASLNKVFLMGNLTRDPELRYTAGGTAVADLGLAVNQKFVSRNTNEQKNEVVFVDVTVWGKQAEACGEYLAKGSNIFVEGRLQLDTWESKDGQRRNRLRVVAQRVQFIGKPRGARSEAPVKQGAGNMTQEVSSNAQPGEAGDMVQEESFSDGNEEVPF